MSDWTLKPLQRPMMFLGRKLFQVSTPLYVCNLHHSALPDDPDAVRLPLDDDARAGGAYIRSQPVTQDLPRFALRGPLLRYVPSHYDHFFVDLTGTFKDYMGRFTAKSRYKLNRTVKKFQEAAGTKDCFKLYRTPDEILEFHQHAQKLVPLTYQARVFDNQLPDTAQFKQQLRALALEERTLGALLLIKGEPVVFWWFTRHGSVLVSEYTGFDPAHRDLAPGTALLYLVIEQMFADARVQVFDFGEGALFYKEHFATGSRRCAEVFYLRARPRTLSMVSLDTGFWAMRRALRPVEDELERRGVKARLKRLLRG